MNPYNGEDLPSRFTAPRPRVGGRHAAGRIFGFRLCVTARPRVGGTLAVTLVSLFTQENPFSDTSDEIIECMGRFSRFSPRDYFRTAGATARTRHRAFGLAAERYRVARETEN